MGREQQLSETILQLQLGETLSAIVELQVFILGVSQRTQGLSGFVKEDVKTEI